MVGPLYRNSGLTWLEIGANPAGWGDLRSSLLRPLFSPFWSGAGLPPSCSHFFPVSLCPISRDSTSSCASTASTSRSVGVVPSSQTSSPGQKPAGCVYYGLFWCQHWGPLSLLNIGPGRVLGPAPSPLSALGWRVGGMRLLSGSVFRRWQPCSSPCMSCGSTSPLLYSPEVNPGQSGPLPLHVACRHRDHWQSHHILSQPIVTITLVIDFVLRQYHQFEAANLYHPDGLNDTGALAIADVESPKG